MLFGASMGEPWPQGDKEKRESRFVFIGRDLDRQVCMYTSTQATITHAAHDAH